MSLFNLSILALLWLIPFAFPINTMTINDIEFIYVPAGKFHQGKAGDDKNPEQITTISDGYWVSKYEITQAQYQNIMGNNPSIQKGDNHPVENINWHDARIFCEVLNEKNSKNKIIPQDFSFRLPTDLEWEYAAKGGSKDDRYTYAGSNDVNEVAWFGPNSGSAHHPVGLKAPNSLGLYDLSGNVWEWCLNELPKDRTQKPVPSKTKKGGCFFNGENTLSITNIGEMEPENKGQRYGMRVVLIKR